MAANKSQPADIGDVIAHRVLELAADDGVTDVHIYIGRPEPSADGKDWSCPFEITGLPGKRVRRAYGLDAVQALDLTLWMIGSILYTSEAWRAGHLTLEGGRNLMFPVVDNIQDIVPD